MHRRQSKNIANSSQVRVQTGHLMQGGEAGGCADGVCVAGIVQGGSLPYICTQIMTIVDQEQSKVLWTPLGCP